MSVAHASVPPPAETADAAEVSRAPRVLSTLNPDGSRKWLNPRPMPGRFLTARRIVAWALILLFTILPYTKINGWPTVLLDVPARRFHLFGTTFYPTDTLLLAFFMVSVFVSIFLITAILGRVWCGWACPQTVYMEFVYRPIERLFSGIPGRTSKGPLARLPFAAVWKYLIFLFISLFLAHTFLAYFVGVERLLTWITRPPSQHPVGFMIVAIVTALMLFDFGFFREQMCIVACPYGRFQSVMLDRTSLIISYDRARGEPRGFAKRGAAKADVALPVMERTTGDCVDCHKCVVTCPTGIDIRNGLQMECVGCAQCIDACDAVMAKLGRPLGLIRYASQAAMAGGRPHILRPRVIIYTLILAVLATLFGVTLSRRGPADVRVLRGLGPPFVLMGEQDVGNQLRVKITNRTDRPASYTLNVAGVDGARVEAEGFPVIIPPGAIVSTPAMVIAPRGAFTRGKCTLTLNVAGPDGFTSATPFLLQGPGAGYGAHPQAPTTAAPSDQESRP